MAKRLALVPDAPKTILERFAEMADEEFARAEMLAKRVRELEAQIQSERDEVAYVMTQRLADIADLKVELREVRAVYLLLVAATRNVLAAHESGDEALLDEALARMEEVVDAGRPAQSVRGHETRDA